MYLHPHATKCKNKVNKVIILLFFFKLLSQCILSNFGDSIKYLLIYFFKVLWPVTETLAVLLCILYDLFVSSHYFHLKGL